MRCNTVGGVLAATCHVGKTAVCCKGYQAALLLQILQTEMSPSYFGSKRVRYKNSRSLFLQQAKVSEPRQMGSCIPVGANIVPCPLLLMHEKSAWGKKKNKNEETVCSCCR